MSTYKIICSLSEDKLGKIMGGKFFLWIDAKSVQDAYEKIKNCQVGSSTLQKIFEELFVFEPNGDPFIDDTLYLEYENPNTMEIDYLYIGQSRGEEILEKLDEDSDVWHIQRKRERE